MAAQLLEGENDARAPIATAGKIRKEVRLTPEELEHVTNAAKNAGMREVRWIVALIRASMGQRLQLGEEEMVMLGRSNLALLAIGRNLNQLVRAAFSGDASATADLVAVLGALRVQLTSHVDSVAKLLSANQIRWRS